jgi:hypothetical protein
MPTNKELPNSIFLLINKFTDKFNKITMIGTDSFSIDYLSDQQKDLSLFLKALALLDKKDKTFHIKINKFDRVNRRIEIKILKN